MLSGSGVISFYGGSFGGYVAVSVVDEWCYSTSSQLLTVCSGRCRAELSTLTHYPAPRMRSGGVK